MKALRRLLMSLSEVTFFHPSTPEIQFFIVFNFRWSSRLFLSMVQFYVYRKKHILFLKVFWLRACKWFLMVRFFFYLFMAENIYFSWFLIFRSSFLVFLKIGKFHVRENIKIVHNSLIEARRGIFSSFLEYHFRAEIAFLQTPFFYKL